MTTLEILRAAREKISTPKRWTKGWFARTASGLETRVKALDAVCWCSLGAVMAVAPSEKEFYLAVGSLNDAWGDGLLAGKMNDAPERTHAEVLAAFDRAIEALTHA